MVLESNKRKIKSGVAIEEKDERKVYIPSGSTEGVGGGELGPVSLLGIIEVKLRIQPPPPLVVPVNALTTDGKLNSLDRTLCSPATIK
jgi:hypothetical protein